MKVTDVVVGGFEGQDTVIPAIGKSMTKMRVGRNPNVFPHTVLHS